MKKKRKKKAILLLAYIADVSYLANRSFYMRTLSLSPFSTIRFQRIFIFFDVVLHGASRCRFRGPGLMKDEIFHVQSSREWYFKRYRRTFLQYCGFSRLCDFEVYKKPIFEIGDCSIVEILMIICGISNCY